MDRATAYELRLFELQRIVEEKKALMLRREQELFEQRQRVHDAVARTRSNSFKASVLAEDRSDSK